MKLGKRIAAVVAAAVVGGALPASPVEAAVVDDNLAATTGGFGGARVFARGDSGTLVANRWNGSGWTGWSDFGGMQLTSGPSASTRPADGTIDVFAKGPDDAIWHRYLTAGVWSDWGSIGGITSSAPASTSRMSTGELDVIVKGGDNGLYHKYWTPTGGWSGWGSLGGLFIYAPAVISHEPGKLDVFGIGTDHQLYQKHWNGSSWSGWIGLGGYLTSAPTVESQQSGKVDVFARDANGNIAQRSWNGTAWSAWVTIPTIATSGPTAFSEGPGRVVLFVRGGAQTYVNQLLPGSWTGWVPFGATAGPVGIPPEPYADSFGLSARSSGEEVPFVPEDDEGRAVAASATCKSYLHRTTWDNVAGMALARINQQFNWCWDRDSGRINYLRRYYTRQALAPLWGPKGGWLTDSEGGRGRTTYRSIVSHDFALCMGIGSFQGCPQHITLTSDFIVGPRSWVRIGPLDSDY